MKVVEATLEAVSNPAQSNADQGVKPGPELPPTQPLKVLKVDDVDLSKKDEKTEEILDINDVNEIGQDEAKTSNLELYKDLPFEMEMEDPSGYNSMRRCQDVFWILLYLVFTLGMGLIAYVTFMYGDLRRISYGRDSEGNLCGVGVGLDSTRDFSASPFVFYFNMSDTDTYRICIDSCPLIDETVCKYDTVNPSNPNNLLNGTCVLNDYPTSQFLLRCIPTWLSPGAAETPPISKDQQLLYAQTLNDDFGSSITSLVYRQIAGDYLVLIVCGVIAFVLGFLWIVLLQMASDVIIWTTIVGLIICVWAIAFFCLYSYASLIDSDVSSTLNISSISVNASVNNKSLFLAGSIVSLIAALGVTGYVLASRASIKLSVTMISETKRCFKSIKHILWFPVARLFYQLVLLGFSVYIFFTVTTTGSIVTQALASQINGVTHALILKSTLYSQFNIAP